MKLGPADDRMAAKAAFQAARQLYQRALGNPVPPGNNRHLAASRLNLGQQRRLLLRRPLPPPLNPRQDLYIRQSRLLAEEQNPPPATQT